MQGVFIFILYLGLLFVSSITLAVIVKALAIFVPKLNLDNAF